jgi:hypothetical protein
MNGNALKRGLLWGLVLFSVGSLILMPLRSVKESIIDILPWVGIGVVMTETLFIIGLCLMATAIGLKVQKPRDLLRLRSELKEILRSATTTKSFWVGFWMNAVGAVGSGVVFTAGIVAALPVSSWGLAIVSTLDIFVTVAIRQHVLQAHTRERTLS